MRPGRRRDHGGGAEERAAAARDRTLLARMREICRLRIVKQLLDSGEEMLNNFMWPMSKIYEALGGIWEGVTVGIEGYLAC